MTERTQGDASELEGGGTGQNWGQGEGHHEPTIPGPDDDPDPSYSGGTAAQIDDAETPLSRDDEGMDR